MVKVEASLDDVSGHLQIPGLPGQYASMADAYLVAEKGELVPIHKSLLAVWSPVLSDLFQAATRSPTGDLERFPMPGHTVADICRCLKFLYNRVTVQAAETPSKDLWQSVEGARPIIQFAHKFNMQSILQECDTCLASQAAEDGKRIFKDNDTTVAWAALAEECGLKTLLAHAELFMVKDADPSFWQSPAFHKYKLSISCMLRMLQAAQLNMKDWSSKFTPGVLQEGAQSTCRNCSQRVWCPICARSSPDKKNIGAHASLSQMIKWQQASTLPT